MPSDDTRPVPVTITELTVNNLKVLKAIRILPDGNTVIIGGRNGAGKSTVLDAIWYALGGKPKVAVPVRDGEESAQASVTLSDGKTVTRRWTKKGTTLVIKNAEGLTFSSPQRILDEFLGGLTVDPLAFIEMKPKAQLDTLKRLVGVDLSDIDDKRAALYSKRTGVNADVKRLQGALDNMPAVPDGTPVDEVLVADLMGELEAAQAVNRGHDVKRLDLGCAKSDSARADDEAKWASDYVAEVQESVKESEGNVRDVKAEARHAAVNAVQDAEAVKAAAIELAESQFANAKAAAQSAEDRAVEAARSQVGLAISEVAEAKKKAEAWKAKSVQAALDCAVLVRECSELVDADETSIRDRINGAETVNTNVRIVKECKRLGLSVANAKDGSSVLTDAINQCDKEKSERMAAATFPVHGLAFSEYGVTFGGLPFSQSSSAEQLRVSVAMGLAANPKLGVLFIKNGSLLDPSNMALVAEIAAEANAQVWIERVGNADEGAVIIEDGEVVE